MGLLTHTSPCPCSFQEVHSSQALRTPGTGFPHPHTIAGPGLALCFPGSPTLSMWALYLELHWGPGITQCFNLSNPTDFWCLLEQVPLLAPLGEEVRYDCCQWSRCLVLYELHVLKLDFLQHGLKPILFSQKPGKRLLFYLNQMKTLLQICKN